MFAVLFDSWDKDIAFMWQLITVLRYNNCDYDLTSLQHWSVNKSVFSVYLFFFCMHNFMFTYMDSICSLFYWYANIIKPFCLSCWMHAVLAGLDIVRHMSFPGPLRVYWIALGKAKLVSALLYIPIVLQFLPTIFSL